VVRFTLRPIYPITYISASCLTNFWSVCTIRNNCMFVFMLNNWLLSFPSYHATPFEVHRRRIPTRRSLIHSEMRCCYRNSVCDGVLRITICVLCTPLWTKELLIWRTFYSRNRDAHYVCGLVPFKQHLTVKSNPERTWELQGLRLLGLRNSVQKLVRFTGLHTDRLYLREIFFLLISVRGSVNHWTYRGLKI